MYWTCAADILVRAVQEDTEEIWCLMDLCSPSRGRGEHIVVSKKHEGEVLKQRYCSVVATFKYSFIEATSCGVLVLLDTVSKYCGPSWRFL